MGSHLSTLEIGIRWKFCHVFDQRFASVYGMIHEKMKNSYVRDLLWYYKIPKYYNYIVVARVNIYLKVSNDLIKLSFKYVRRISKNRILSKNRIVVTFNCDHLQNHVLSHHRWQFSSWTNYPWGISSYERMLDSPLTTPYRSNRKGTSISDHHIDQRSYRYRWASTQSKIMSWLHFGLALAFRSHLEPFLVLEKGSQRILRLWELEIKMMNVYPIRVY